MEDMKAFEASMRALMNFRTQIGSQTKGETLIKGEMACLHIIYNCKKVYPKHLSERLKLSTGRVGNILKSLEDQGYIKREDDGIDNRKTVVTITDKGSKIISSFDQGVAKHINMIVEAMGREDFYKLLDLFEKMTQVMNDIKEERRDV